MQISAALPRDVCIPPGASGIPFAFFDDFSWRSFVALIWPALPDERGAPDLSASVGAADRSVVFDTYKADWELFQPNGGAPAAWLQRGPANPCPNVASLGAHDLVLASFTKFENVGQADFGTLVGPLVAQNGTYAVYLAGFNKVEFDQIVERRWFLRSNLQSVNFTPDASGNNPIDVKSSWVLIRNNKPDKSRFYTRRAWVYDLQTNLCSEQTVALVGLHIVTKTASRPQWIWSTFEHVDNVPEDGASAPFTFNDGSGTAMTDDNTVSFPPPATPPPPFNVTRLQRIATSTAATNAKYQAALATRGSGVWRFYRLVMTQWPNPGDAPANPGTPAFTFPGNGATTPFANVTMETFQQRSIRKGCMACHNIVGPANAGSNTDFLWALQMNAFPPNPGTSPSQPQFHTLMRREPSNPALRALKRVLESKN
ncbi:MAG: hypothetical protein WDO68_17025 [Gammaproteobacteria bacterium]